MPVCSEQKEQNIDSNPARGYKAAETETLLVLESIGHTKYTA